LILVFDHEPLGSLAALDAKIRACNLAIPHRIICYGKWQRRVADFVHWPWVNSWLSWTIGLADTTTRHAVLQDLDAMLIKPTFLEERYRFITEQNCQYVSTRWYNGNGLEPADEFCTTFELFFDVDYVRKHCRPVDLFNHISLFDGRSVDFDTFLYVQSRGGTRRRLEPGDLDMVHPAELICQFRYWIQDDHRFNLRAHGLPILLYFLWLGGETKPLVESTKLLRESSDKALTLRGKPIPIDQIQPDYMAWLIEQITRLETAVAGAVRPEVTQFIDGISSRGLPVSRHAAA
jgi:hypothetical protein